MGATPLAQSVLSGQSVGLVVAFEDEGHEVIEGAAGVG